MSTSYAVESDKTAADLIQRMRGETLIEHEKLDQCVMAANPFASRENFGKFLCMQYCLHRDIEPLLQRADLAALFPGLASRSRLAAVEQDLADLGLALPTEPAPLRWEAPLDRIEAVGWLFTAEGSRLGGASLFRRAAALGLNESFGARHLAVPAAGPAEGWRAFCMQVHALNLDAAQQEQALVGSRAAFQHVYNLALHFMR